MIANAVLITYLLVNYWQFIVIFVLAIAMLAVFVWMSMGRYKEQGMVKQPSWKSSCIDPRSPVLSRLRHRIEYCQQLSHASRQSQLFRLPCRQQPLIEGSEYRVASTGDQRTHVEHCSQPGSAAPHAALAPTRTAVPVEGCHAAQSGDPLAVESTQLRQVCQKRQLCQLAPPNTVLRTYGVPQSLVSVRYDQFHSGQATCHQ